LEKFLESSSSIAEHGALRKVVLLRWSGAGAVSAGGESGGAIGSLCFGVLRVGEGRVPTREYAGRGAARIALSPLAGRTTPSPCEA